MRKNSVERNGKPARRRKRQSNTPRLVIGTLARRTPYTTVRHETLAYGVA
jgi:hypothetical protein